MQHPHISRVLAACSTLAQQCDYSPYRATSPCGYVCMCAYVCVCVRMMQIIMLGTSHAMMLLLSISYTYTSYIVVTVNVVNDIIFSRQQHYLLLLMSYYAVTLSSRVLLCVLYTKIPRPQHLSCCDT